MQLARDLFKSILDNGIGGYGWRYASLHPWLVAMNWARRMKWFFQRGWRGYSDCDNWNIRSYLNSWMPMALQNLRWAKYGYPVGLKCRCEWEMILNKMQRGFEANKKMDELDFDFKTEKGMKEFKRLKRESREGLKLFAKHFHSLWD